MTDSKTKTETEVELTKLFCIKKKTLFDDDGCQGWCEFEFQGVCDCPIPDDPRYHLERIDVDIVGRPVATKPADTTYRIRIYTGMTTRSQTESSPGRTNWSDTPTWTGLDMLIEFTLSSSIDRWTRERKYQEVIKKYIPSVPTEGYDCAILKKTDIRARSSAESYYLYFWSLIAQYQTPAETMAGGDCPHSGKKCRKGRRK